MEYLGCLVLDGLHLDLVGRVLPLAVPHRLLQPQDGVHGYGVPARPLELVEVLHEVLGAGKEAGGQPHQLPAPFLGQPVSVLRQLLHDLAVYFIAKDLLQDIKKFKNIHIYVQICTYIH